MGDKDLDIEVDDMENIDRRFVEGIEPESMDRSSCSPFVDLKIKAKGYWGNRCGRWKSFCKWRSCNVAWNRRVTDCLCRKKVKEWSETLKMGKEKYAIKMGLPDHSNRKKTM